MLRILKLTAIICLYTVVVPSVALKTQLVNGRPIKQISTSDSTDSSNTKVTPSVIESEEKQQEKHYYHPVEEKHPHVVEQFNRQHPDGSYEYKYVLSNGVTRYEKAFWKRVGAKGKKLLARKGFYSHPLKDHKYLTVFYTADEHGFQQDTAKLSKSLPTLPKYLDVAQLEFPHETSTILMTTLKATKPTRTTRTTRTTSTTQKPKTTRKMTTRYPKVTTTQRPVEVKPSQFNWIY